MTTTPTSKRPSHRVVHEIRKDGKTVRRQEIGAIWPHSTGNGFNLKLDYMPVGGGWFTIYPIDADEDGAA